MLTSVVAVIPGVAIAALANIRIAPQASPSGFQVGAGIFDTVTLGEGTSPAGTLTFRLFGPEDPNCQGQPLFTTTTAVTGNGYYSSASFVTRQAGTYRWIASYSGDTRNAPATTRCDDPAQEVALAKRKPTLAAVTSTVSPTGRISDVATLGKGEGPNGPTGTVTFTLYGPDNLVCAGAPIFTSTRQVAGNGVYRSDSFAPRATGSYRWVARYGGDANNHSAVTICSDEAQAVTVNTIGKRAKADFTGDGKADASVYRSATGTLHVHGGDPAVTNWGETGDIPVPGDYDGNGATDFAVYRPATGTWHVRGGSTVAWGETGDIPVPGDYDGNGTTDFAVYRPLLGLWFVRGGSSVLWGLVGDVPVPADYDGNGRTDFAVYRPLLGTWYVLQGSTSFWGLLSDDIPVPADYDGNGTDDMAIYRRGTGTWYVRGGSPSTLTWGLPGDVPVPGDYDGDGKAEMAVYRPLAGTWYIATASPTVVPWGEPNDVPANLSAAIRIGVR